MKRKKNAATKVATFEDAYQAFKAEYEIAYALSLAPDFVEGRDARPARRGYTARALVAAHHLVRIVLQEKQIPASCARKFERFMQAMPKRRIPKDTVAWFNKNLAGLQLLLESAAWTDKGAREDRLVRIGPFVVHNQTQADDITATAKILETAEVLLRDSGVPQIDTILYGDVYFVGQIEKNRKVSAKYIVDSDVIFVLVVKRFQDSMLDSVIHEFGHRYYRKVMSLEQRGDWLIHHERIAYEATQNADVTLPAVGSSLSTDAGMKIIEAYGKTRKGDPAMIFVGGGGILVEGFIRTQRKIARQRAYPTVYSETDDEEHFCDALSLFCRGELAEPHRTNFEAILGVAPKSAPIVVPPSRPHVEIPVGTQRSLFENPARARTRRLGAKIGGA